MPTLPSRSASMASCSRSWLRPSGEAGRYEIIAGERRWRAAQRAGLTQIPVIVRDVNDRVALELAIIENVQRADLNPVEEALGYQQLLDEHNYTQADLGQIIGKSRSHVANTLRLLKLPDPVRDMIVDGSLSAGHARTLVTPKIRPGWPGASSKAACRSARRKRWRSSRRKTTMARAPPPAAHRQGRRHDGAGKAAVGRVGAQGGDQPQGKGRRGAHFLPHARAARRALPAAEAADLNVGLPANLIKLFVRRLTSCAGAASCRSPACALDRQPEQRLPDDRLGQFRPLPASENRALQPVQRLRDRRPRPAR